VEGWKGREELETGLIPCSWGFRMKMYKFAKDLLPRTADTRML
jgi:hypothetical protein